MAKFDREEWERKMARDIAAEEQQRAAQAGCDAKMDEEFMADFHDIFELHPSELKKIMGDIPKVTPQDVTEAQAVIKKAKKAYDRGNRAKAKKLLKGNATVQKAKKAKKKGCAVLAIALLGSIIATAGAALYGAAEVLAAVLP